MGLVTAIALGVGAAVAGVGAAKAAKEQRKAVESAQQAAVAQEERATVEARRTEERIEAATRLTPEEKARETRAFELEERRLPVLEERAGVPGEELIRRAGPISGSLLDQILAETRDPEAFFESTLEPELELARQFVNKEAVRRGVFEGLPEGGIRFEQLGRAGVELAIKSAQARQSSRQQALSNAAEVIRSAVGEETQARGELDKFLGSIQTLSAEARGRAGQGVVAGQQVATPITREAAARRSGAEQEIAGVQFGEAAATRRTFEEGLSSIVTAGLSPRASTAAELFKQETLERTPTARLSEITGSELFERFPDVRR